MAGEKIENGQQVMSMNILVLNGSPRGESSNTLKVTNAFLSGLKTDSSGSVQTITVSKAHIEHCLGCFACWKKTPGKCVINDDMPDFIGKYMEADLIVWSFPLYYYGMPSKIKCFLDRLLPTNLPNIEVKENGENTHPSRYGKRSSQRHVLISTCGFCNIAGNYDPLFKQFEILFGGRLTKIICPEGELLRTPQMSARVDEYLSYVTKAGSEFSQSGNFSAETQGKLDELLLPPEIFVEAANKSWNG